MSARGPHGWPGAWEARDETMDEYTRQRTAGDSQQTSKGGSGMSKSRNRWLFFDKIEAPRFGRRARLVRADRRKYSYMEGVWQI